MNWAVNLKPMSNKATCSTLFLTGGTQASKRDVGVIVQQFRSDIDFQEFCLQVLLECVSKDMPALLQDLRSFSVASNEDLRARFGSRSVLWNNGYS
ncbi:hypothetical protein RchiOBHm_Chr3g0496051 [Rosa chinensis]|uniref:Anaphase-promoting complex subunit 1 C-terminal domain-containing protein n=1 Tax=Rosa chinensis TaxID=74649 RepID=A0A2P6RHD5_ROSCH|nr:hypothetical protein RchiOBHm_Chr3g0496051 [Rosa chinensis]